eukprot:sb/3468402/
METLDFYLCILYTAVHSYRSASLVKPLPDSITSLEELTAHFEDKTDSGSLSWVNRETSNYLCQPFTPSLTSEFISQEEKYLPQFVLTIKAPREPEEFTRLSAAHGTRIAFHGTHTENVYSILKNGLAGHLNRRALFGSGIYLSSDLDIAYSFAQSGKTWPLSKLGGNMRCVLVCKVVKSFQVRVGKEKLSGISFDTGSLPHNYFVVENNDHVQITHVLIYTVPKKPGKSWLKTHGVLVLYVFLLLAVCLFTNQRKILKLFK